MTPLLCLVNCYLVKLSHKMIFYQSFNNLSRLETIAELLYLTKIISAQNEYEIVIKLTKIVEKHGKSINYSI